MIPGAATCVSSATTQPPRTAPSRQRTPRFHSRSRQTSRTYEQWASCQSQQIAWPVPASRTVSHERLWQAHDLPTRTRSNCSNVTQPPGDTASKARCICCTSAGFTARRKHSQVRLQKPPEGKPEQRARTVQLWHQASQPFSRATQARANTNGHGRSTELSLCVKVLQVAHGVAKVGIRLIGDEPFM